MLSEPSGGWGKSVNAENGGAICDEYPVAAAGVCESRRRDASDRSATVAEDSRQGHSRLSRSEAAPGVEGDVH